MVKYESSEKAINSSRRNLRELINDYKSYLDQARTPTQVVRVSAQILETNGFKKFEPGKDLSKYRSKKLYFVDRNGVNIAAVKFGSRPISEGVNIAGAHIDFVTLTNKIHSIMEKSDGVYLDVKPYGGFFPHVWRDRPLHVIGETLVRSNNLERKLVEWKMNGHIPEPTVHNPKGYRTMKYADAFQMENLDVFMGYKTAKSFLKALNRVKKGNEKITREDFDSGFNSFHVVPAEKTHLLGNYIIGYGHDDRVCMFTALRALIESADQKFVSITLGVNREEVGSASVSGANDVFLENVMKILCQIQGEDCDVEEIYTKSTMLSADVSIAYNPQNAKVQDKNNSSKFGKGTTITIANGSNGNPTGNVVLPNDLAFIERFLDQKDLAYQVDSLPSKVGIGGGGGTIAKFYSEKGILTADMGIPVGAMHSTMSRVYAPDLDSTLQAFIALFERKEERIFWG